MTDSWSYASANSATAPSDATTRYSVGDKVKFDQTTTKYFYITAVTATTVTLNGGSDYTVANAAIANIYYSKAETPLSFPGFFNYTPTLTNITLGNGTTVARFKMAGKQVSGYITITFGSTSAMATDPKFSVPITMSSNMGTGVITFTAKALDVGANRYDLFATPDTTTTIYWSAKNSAGTYVSQTSVSSTVPFTWGSTDAISCVFQYEAA